MWFRASCVYLTFASILLPATPWRSLRIVPGNIVFAQPGDSQRFMVLARAADGTEENVTSQSSVQSTEPTIVSLHAKPALLTAHRPGQSKISARFAGLRASISVEVRNRASTLGVRFSPDVISVLTIKGCNSSGCHGSPAGQSGFKLSLFGYDVSADHAMIVRANNGRRINTSRPEESLLLRKPLFEVAHGGGRLLTRDSEEYKTLLEWLKQGGNLESDDLRVTSLEMYPSEQVLNGKGATTELIVVGRLSDGTTRDMTREVRYSSTDDGVAAVTSEGVVSASKNGLATVLARGMGNVAAAQIGVALAPRTRAYSKPVASSFIDDLVFDKQRRLGVEPEALCTDREFIRRVFLDTVGLLPTAEDVDAFIMDSRPGKRQRLIDRLLQMPEYATFWTVKFEDWFRNNQVSSQGRSMGKFKEWLFENLAQDRPYSEVVRELITSEGDTFQNPAANFWHPAADFMLKKFDVKKVTPTVSRLFLGVRLECAECHNHPLENFTQDDFYGMSAFFARLRVKHGTAEYRRTWFLEDEGELSHPVTKVPVAAKLLGGPSPKFAPGEDRRTALADWITSPANPYFAKATVNRIWNEYFQAGIVEPFDDFRSTNPATNRELLDRLATYFIDSGFKLKSIHRLILSSRTYQLASNRNKRAENGALERLLFASYQPRQLSAEVLLDAVSQVTGMPHSFKNYPPGTRAMEIDTPDTPDYFLLTFGLPRRDILCERSKSPTLGQALHMINGATVMQKVEAKDNVLTTWLAQGRTDREIVGAIYARAYARIPSEEERQTLVTFLDAEQTAGRSRRRALEGVLWTVLNSKEFQVNY